MYEKFFQLEKKPFELVPTPGLLFMSRTHRKALSYLEYGFQERSGFILLTGEVGSGKTTIIKNLVRTLDDNISRAMIFNTMVSAEQLIAMILEEFGLVTAGKDKVGLLGVLNDFLVEQYALNRLPLVIIDEAQNLSSQALEEVRLLSNLETDSSKLLQIVLVGQPELKDIIAQPCLRQLRQRIGINCHLGTLNREETEEYVFHRLEQAGNRDAVNFQAGTFDVLYQHSGGVPRIINIFCDFILLTAFVEGTRELTTALVGEVVSDLNFDLPGHSGEPVGNGNRENDKDAAERSEAKGGQVAEGSLRDQLSKHKTVLRKVIKVQQRQIKRLEDRLEHIDHQLGLLNEGVGSLNNALAPAGPGGVKGLRRTAVKIVEAGGLSHEVRE